VNRELVWVIDVFVVDAKDRQQGKGEEALLQLLHEIRDNEYKLIKKIYRNLIDKDVPFKAARAASEGSSDNIIKIIEEKITGPNASDKLDIRLGDVDPDAQGFWRKMYNRYGGYDREGKYLGLKKSTTITTTTGKTKTVNQPLVEDDEEEPPEEEERNYCIEKYTEIFKEIETVYERLFNLGNEVNLHYGTLIHANDMNPKYIVSRFSRQVDDKYVEYIGGYFYEWGSTTYNGKNADRIFGCDMLAPLPNKLTEEEACYLLFILSQTNIFNRVPNFRSFRTGEDNFYYYRQLNTDSVSDYFLTTEYRTGILFEWFSGYLKKGDQRLTFYNGYDTDMKLFFSKVNTFEDYLLKIINMAKEAVRGYPDGKDYFERFY
tara:strand:- start:2713 stop:3837 length:1125 start_codon:yes stop_codon:yes gene_type:complete